MPLGMEVGLGPGMNSQIVIPVLALTGLGVKGRSYLWPILFSVSCILNLYLIVYFVHFDTLFNYQLLVVKRRK